MLELNSRQRARLSSERLTLSKLYAGLALTLGETTPASVTIPTPGPGQIACIVDLIAMSQVPGKHGGVLGLTEDQIENALDTRRLQFTRTPYNNAGDPETDLPTFWYFLSADGRNKRKLELKEDIGAVDGLDLSNSALEISFDDRRDDEIQQILAFVKVISRVEDDD